MHMSGPSRGVVSKGKLPMVPYPPKRVGGMAVIVIAGVGP